MSEPPPGTGTASIAAPDRPAGLRTATSIRTWSRSFPATPDQVREARRFLAAILGDSPLTSDAQACVSELAANAVLHSNSRRPGGYFSVHARLRPGVLRVEVEDEGGPWAPRHTQDGQRGRGLTIVEGLSSQWFISGDGTGTRTVWFEVTHP